MSIKLAKLDELSVACSILRRLDVQRRAVLRNGRVREEYCFSTGERSGPITRYKKFTLFGLAANCFAPDELSELNGSGD